MLDIKLEPLEIKDTGTVKEVREGVVKVDGLSFCVNGQLVEFAPSLMGMVIGFNKKEVLVLVLGDETKINIGDTVYGETGIFEIPVGNNFLGRIINTFGQPLDGRGKISENDMYPIFRDAPGVLDRKPITETFHTGIKMIDTTIPLGKGQRELIMGDRVIGKTSIVTEAIINQKDKNVICVYCWIGGSHSAFVKILEELKRGGAMDYTIIVVASASDSPAEQYLVPYAACAAGEYFMDNGRDVLIAYDNLSRHAWSYREISLLLERSPGREAYPGDIFYIHSRLLERACKFSEKKGGGSLSAIPIAQTQGDDISAYIPTNLISITDGQIILDTNLFNQGIRPAVNIGLSVSRVGGAAQTKAIKKVAGTLKLELAQYNELLAFAQFGSELDRASQEALNRGRRAIEILKQPEYETYSFVDQAIFLFLLKENYLDDLEIDHVKDFSVKFASYVKGTMLSVYEHIFNTQDLDEQTITKLKKAVEEFKVIS